jgi:hypothetical protein
VFDPAPGSVIAKTIFPSPVASRAAPVVFRDVYAEVAVLAERLP